MTISEKTIPTFTASFTLGLQKGYTNKMWTIPEVYGFLKEVQINIDEEFHIKLSAQVTPCSIVFKGQQEPSLTFSFIQYPLYPVAEDKLRHTIKRLVRDLMTRLEQNRTVVLFPDQTIMLQGSDEVDPKIAS